MRKCVLAPAVFPGVELQLCLLLFRVPGWGATITQGLGTRVGDGTGSLRVRVGLPGSVISPNSALNWEYRLAVCGSANQLWWHATLGQRAVGGGRRGWRCNVHAPRQMR